MPPQDPIILLSYVNTQLRDRDASLAAFCDRKMQTKRKPACPSAVGYICDAQATVSSDFVAGCTRRYKRGEEVIPAMNFVFLSATFPKTYWNFCERLHRNGVNVLGIGDAPFDEIPGSSSIA